MTNQEGMWGVVLLIGLIFLVGIPFITASFSAMVYALSGIFKNMKARFAAFTLAAIVALGIVMLLPAGGYYYSLAMLPYAALAVLIAAGHGMTFTVFEDRFSPVRGYLLLFISAAVCSVIIMFAYISVISIPAYLQTLGKLQYILYFTLSMVVPTVVFVIASKLFSEKGA